MRRKIGHVAEDVPRRLLERHRDHLDVLRPLVDHQYVTDRIAPDQRHRRDLLAAQHQYVQRIPVVRIGARNKTVVRRIVRRRVQNAVQNEHPRLFVDLVFVLAPLGDLDHRDEIFGRDALRRNVVPNVHSSSPPPPAASSRIKLYYTSPPIAIVLDIFFVILLPKPFFCANIIEQIAPKWWNWQTRRTQNPVMATSCGFKSRLRHQKPELTCSGFFCANAGPRTRTNDSVVSVRCTLAHRSAVSPFGAPCKASPAFGTNNGRLALTAKIRGCFTASYFLLFGSLPPLCEGGIVRNCDAHAP